MTASAKQAHTLKLGNRANKVRIYVMINVIPFYLKARLKVPVTILKTPTALNKND